MYNKKQLLKLIQERKGWDISYITFFSWQKKGYVSSNKRMNYIGRSIPVYDEEDYHRITEELQRLNKEGKVRIKVLTR